MIFLSPHKNLRVLCIPQKTELAADGTREIVEHAYMAEFRYMALTPELEDIAREHLHFRGTNLMPDQTTIVDPVRQRVSTFDTSWVPEPIRERVEQALLSNTRLGQSYIRADDKTPKPQKPWPRYDEWNEDKNAAKHIAALARAFGVDIERAIAYERANLNRPDVIAALEELASETVEVAA